MQASEKYRLNFINQNETLEKVSTYNEEAVREVCPKLTRLLKKCETKSMQTIRTKYSHE